MHVQNKKNKEITDKWVSRHTFYVAIATQNLKASAILVYGHVHIVEVQFLNHALKTYIILSIQLRLNFA